MRQAAYGFIIAAMIGILLDWPFEVFVFLLIAAAMLAAFAPLGPSRERRDARRRNHAHRVR